MITTTVETRFAKKIISLWQFGPAIRSVQSAPNRLSMTTEKMRKARMVARTFPDR